MVIHVKCYVRHYELTVLASVVSEVMQSYIPDSSIILLGMDKLLRRNTEGERREIRWRVREQLENIDSADVVCFLSQNFNSMKEKLEYIQEQARKSGLEM